MRTVHTPAAPAAGNLLGMTDGDPRSDGSVLLTGATGFLGMQLLVRYLERTDRRVHALVRARDESEAAARVACALGSMLPDAAAYADRVVAVPGDIERPDLGLDPRRRDALAEQASEVVHAAASVSFTLPLDRSREINVDGTRHALDFAHLCARRGGLRRFSHVSTAYVAGASRGAFHEDDLDVGQRFRNAYERSKFEAEDLVRAHRERLPIQVFRPSIIVGEQDSGWTPAFNVIYGPLRAFAKGAYSAIPARGRSPVDVVPIDYVADAIFELSRSERGAGETYHLAAGPGATTIGELLDLSARYFGRRPPVTIPPAPYRRVVHPMLLRLGDPARRTALERSEVFFPYFAMRVRYDITRAAAWLAPAGIGVAPIADYLPRLLDYAVTARWGKLPLTRPELLGAAVAPQAA